VALRSAGLAGIRPGRAIRGGGGHPADELIRRRIGLGSRQPRNLVITVLRGLRARYGPGRRTELAWCPEGGLRAVGARQPGRLARRVASLGCRVAGLALLPAAWLGLRHAARLGLPAALLGRRGAGLAAGRPLLFLRGLAGRGQ